MVRFYVHEGGCVDAYVHLLACLRLKKAKGWGRRRGVGHRLVTTPSVRGTSLRQKDWWIWVWIWIAERYDRLTWDYSVLHKKPERSPQKKLFVQLCSQPKTAQQWLSLSQPSLRRSSFSMTQRCGSFIVFYSPLMMPVLWLTHRSVFILLMLSPFNVPDFGRTLQSYSIVAYRSARWPLFKPLNIE